MHGAVPRNLKDIVRTFQRNYREILSKYVSVIIFLEKLRAIFGKL